MLRKEFVIVEDDAIGCEILRQIVESQCGWEVVGISHDGFSGIETILERRPDIVMLDLMMPRCDGFSVMKKVREHNVDCKFFVISSAHDADVINSAVEAGASYFMSKPYFVTWAGNCGELMNGGKALDVALKYGYDSPTASLTMPTTRKASFLTSLNSISSALLMVILCGRKRKRTARSPGCAGYEPLDTGA